MRKIILYSLMFALFSGCMTKNKMVYIQEDHKSVDLGMEFVNEQKRTVIQTFDELFISVSSFNDETPDQISSGGGSASGGRSSTDYSLVSYLVDEDGNIDVPLLGKMQVAGKTADVVAKTIQKELESYFYSPSVKVSFVNKNITVIGMVQRPGRYFYSGENISIFQALGLAGDIQEYGDRESVVVVRENNSRITKNVIDLTDKSLFISDFYYLKSGDVVYVEPLNRRVWGIDRVPFALIFSTATSSLLILEYFRRNNL